MIGFQPYKVLRPASALLPRQRRPTPQCKRTPKSACRASARCSFLLPSPCPRALVLCGGIPPLPTKQAMGCKACQKPKAQYRKGLWSPEEDEKLRDFILRHGHGCWSALPAKAGK